MRSLLLLCALTACGHTALLQEQETDACAEPPLVTLENEPDYRGAVATLLPSRALQVHEGTVQTFDWKGRPLSRVTLPTASWVHVSPLGDSAGLAWHEQGAWHVARLGAAGLETLGEVPGPEGIAMVVQAGAAVQLGVGTRVQVIGGGAFELPGTMRHGFTDGATAVWLSSAKNGPVQLTRVDAAGVRVQRDLELSEPVDAVAPCGGGELIAASFEIISQTPLRSRLRLGRLAVDGRVLEPFQALVPEDRFAWMPALWCEGSRTAVSWIENTEGVAGSLVAATRLVLADGREPRRVLDELPGTAAYFPRLSHDGTSLVVTWTRFGEAGYSTQLQKLPCR